MMFTFLYITNLYIERSQNAVKAMAAITFFSLFSYSSVAFSQQKNTEGTATPSAVIDIVYAQPFSLDQAYIHHSREEKPLVRSGTLAVFKVDPKLVYPRDIAEPVLYVGNQTAMRLNYGHESGYVVAIIPGEINISKSRAWFGTPELPERVNKKTIEMEIALAVKEKVKTLDPERVNKVTRKRVLAEDLSSLLRDHAAELVIRYSPDEKTLAEAWRLPIAKR